MKKICIVTIIITAFLWGCAAKKNLVREKLVEFRAAYTEPCADCVPVSIHNRQFYLSGPVLLNARSIEKAWTQSNDYGTIDIYLNMTADGTKQLEQITRKNINRYLAVLINGRVVMAPKIMEVIYTGKVLITGLLGREEAESIVQQLNR